MAPLKRILLIALAGIGDSLMATPVLRAIRRAYATTQIDVLVMWPGAAQLLGNNPNVNRVLQHNFITSSHAASLKKVGELRRQKYDLSVNLHPQGRREYRWIAFAIGAEQRLSHEYENQSWLDRCLMTGSVPQDYTIHCAENNARLLRACGASIPELEMRYELRLEANEQQEAAKHLPVQQNDLASATPLPVLGIHVGSGGTKNLALRRWPLEYFEQLIGRLLNGHPTLRVALFGGPEEIQPHAALAQKLAMFGARLLIPRTRTLREAAATVARCTDFLSVDTVFMHLAAAVQVPRQYVIQTPTLNPPIYPLRPDWIRIANPAVGPDPLAWYRYDGRSIQGGAERIREAMHSVTVDAVESAITSAWQRIR